VVVVEVKALAQQPIQVVKVVVVEALPQEHSPKIHPETEEPTPEVVVEVEQLLMLQVVEVAEVVL
jgi:hypothetical protein